MAKLLSCPGPTKAFPGFCPSAIAFLRKLKRSSRSAWFAPRREEYEQLVQKPLIDLVCSVSREFARFAPEYATLPEKAVFRIYGETGSSRNSQLSRTHPAALWVCKSLTPIRGACFYFHFTEKEALVMGGVYSAAVHELAAYRRLLHDHYQEFEQILGDRRLRATLGELQGETLKHMPKDLCPNHPAAALMRRKQWYLVSVLDPGLLHTNRLLPELVRHFEVMAPFVQFLNRPFARTQTSKRLAFAKATGDCH